MAEIHVEPKKSTGNTSWIWIVLLLIVAAAVVYYLMTRNKTDDTAAPPASNTTSYIAPSAIPAGHTVYL